MLLVQANAKINLSFKILEKLSNGYHRIESIMQSIDLADFLFFEKSSTRAKPRTVRCGAKHGTGQVQKTQLTGSYICPDAQSLILKAQRVLEKEAGKKLPCYIHLQKVIPISAGLGGGSADAAATLIALNKIYNLNFSKNKLVKLAIKVGADAPFFIFGGTCKVGGVGEEVKQIKKKISKFYLIFRPHKRLETKMMYDLHDKTGKNFLELAMEICPQVKEIYNYLRKWGFREFGLSGSGPSLFCGVNSYNLAQRIIRGIKDFDGDIFICHPQKEALIVFDLK